MYIISFFIFIFLGKGRPQAGVRAVHFFFNQEKSGPKLESEMYIIFIYFQEKAGPKLESETLCLRGDESKFINAMEQKVFMTTFEQD